MLPQGVDGQIRTLLQLQADDDLLNVFTEDLDEAVARFLDLLSSKATTRGKALGCKVYATIYVGLAKRGTITNSKLTAINSAILQETTLDCDITTDDVRNSGQAKAPYIDETNAESVMQGLSGNMTNFSLRLKITMDQTLKAGMTTYWAIDSALRLFSTFPWGEASRYIPDDFVKYQTARGLVVDNHYYGFKNNLGEAAHTHYKSLGWLAIQLLIKFKGSEYGSLVNYRGITPRPDRQADLQRLVDSYVPTDAPRQWCLFLTQSWYLCCV